MISTAWAMIKIAQCSKMKKSHVLLIGDNVKKKYTKKGPQSFSLEQRREHSISFPYLHCHVMRPKKNLCAFSASCKEYFYFQHDRIISFFSFVCFEDDILISQVCIFQSTEKLWILFLQYLYRQCNSFYENAFHTDFVFVFFTKQLTY